MRPSRRSLPLADGRELRGAARRTALERALLAAALLLAVAAAYAAVPGGDLSHALAAGGRGYVVVLDVSGSVTDGQASREIRRTLAQVARSAGPNGQVGLVLFSDSALEALPPTAPASALASFCRFFVPLPWQGTQPALELPAAAVAAAAPPPPRQYPPSPWADSFTGGTEISAGLAEARADLRRAGMSGGRVLLVSDLIDGPADQHALVHELRGYARTPGLSLRVRALSSSIHQPLALYRHVLGRHAVLRAADVPPRPRAPSTPLPLWLVGLALAAALALAAYELLAVPLRWRPVREEPAT